MLMQLLIDTINAVPTPRFDVGENVLEAHDLSSSVVSTLLHIHDQRRPQKEVQYSHHQREQAVVAPNHQEERKVRRTDRLLHRRRQDEVPDKRREAGAHDVVAAILRPLQHFPPQTMSVSHLRPVTVHRLKEHHEPARRVRRHRQPLRIDSGEAESLDELQACKHMLITADRTRMGKGANKHILAEVYP